MNEIRLIDANALKEEINNLAIPIYEKMVLKVIDNAPTVEAISNKEGYEMYNKGYMSGYERGKPERPQGEWIKHCPCSSGGWWIRCSECGAIDKSDGSKTLNYCWNCGAEMREGDKYD